MEQKNANPTSCEAPKPADKKASDMMNQSEGTCCSCEADFKNEVNSLVDDVEGYTNEDRDHKSEELNDAFENNR